MNSDIKEFENLSVEKKTLSTALGFEPRSFDCRSNALTTELHRRPKSSSPREDLLISPSGSALRLSKRVYRGSIRDLLNRNYGRLTGSERAIVRT